MTDHVTLPSVPDNAPSAILFRLSYRANESHRSGYRPADDRDRIVASMRGWWELDPDEVKSLNIKYAVVFHRGETWVVAEIGNLLTWSARHPTSWSAPAAPSPSQGFSRRFFDGARSVPVIHEPDGDRHLVYG